MRPFVPGAVPPQLVPQVGQLMGCPSAFARLHRVQDKDSAALIPFDALPMQQKIFDAVEAGHNRILVVKARQVAATTACKMVLAPEVVGHPARRPLRHRLASGRERHGPPRR